MPTTRKQAALQEANKEEGKDFDMKLEKKKEEVEAGEKREAEQATEKEVFMIDEPPTKKMKADDEKGPEKENKPWTGTKIIDTFETA